MNILSPPPCCSKDEDEDFKITRVTGNEMFYFGPITTEDILDFIEEFKKLEIDLLKKTAEYVGYEPNIRIHICTEGGDLFAGLSAMNILEKSRVKVTTIAQGTCSSAGTFILLGGSERRIGRNAHVLIHQISTGAFWGKYEEVRDEMKWCDKIMGMLTETYEEKANIPSKMFKRLMKRDIYLSPSECIKYNVVHAIE